MARRDATSAGTRIKVTNAARKETVAHFLRKLWPKLVAERDRAASMQLLDALEDVTNQVCRLTGRRGCPISALRMLTRLLR